MHAPELARDARVGVFLTLRRAQREVESDEVEGGADPRDPRDHVEHPQEDVEDVSQVRIHRSLAIATSSRQPVSSSSSRVRADSLAQHGQDLVLRPPVHEDDEAEAELLLVERVQVREVDEHGRVGVLALLGGRARGQPGALADRRVGRERLDLLVLAQRSRGRRRARSRGSSISASRSTRRVRPSKSSLSSSTLSCRGSSRIRTARRGAGRGSGPPRARPRARHA